jgi:protein-S-isoprenylcysteine O-methyltransferase Ste14
MRLLVVGYVLLGAFLALERLLRRDDAARSLDFDTADRGTTRLLGVTFAYAFICGLAGPVLSRLGVAHIDRRGLAVAGVGLMLSGLLLRIWAALTLGRFYTRTLRTTEHQPVVQTGPYRLIRHPGYAAALVMWFGFSLTTQNALVVLTLNGAMLIAYALRMRAEEHMLTRDLGEAYRDYIRRTRRLVPGFY